MIKYNIKHLDIIDSTNSYAINLRESKDFKEGLVITTNFQKKGQGQRGSIWESQKGKNILLSAVFEFNISIKKQFDICKLVSLSLIKLLSFSKNGKTFIICSSCKPFRFLSCITIYTR